MTVKEVTVYYIEGHENCFEESEDKVIDHELNRSAEFLVAHGSEPEFKEALEKARAAIKNQVRTKVMYTSDDWYKHFDTQKDAEERDLRSFASKKLDEVLSDEKLYHTHYNKFTTMILAHIDELLPRLEEVKKLKDSYGIEKKEEKKE